MKAEDYLSLSIDEYRSILDPEIIKNRSWDSIAKTLMKEADWTWDGAHCLCKLAELYGAFILRNATALAIVMNQEDGTLGF